MNEKMLLSNNLQAPLGAWMHRARLLRSFGDVSGEEEAGDAEAASSTKPTACQRGTGHPPRREASQE